MDLQILEEGEKKHPNLLAPILLPSDSIPLVLIGFALARSGPDSGPDKGYVIHPWAQQFHPKNLKKTAKQNIIEFTPLNGRTFFIEGPQFRKALEVVGIVL